MQQQPESQAVDDAKRHALRLAKLFAQVLQAARRNVDRLVAGAEPLAEGQPIVGMLGDGLDVLFGRLSGRREGAGPRGASARAPVNHLRGAAGQHSNGREVVLVEQILPLCIAVGVADGCNLLAGDRVTGMNDPN